MKLNKLMTAIMLLATLGMVACDTAPDPFNGPTKDTTDVPVVDTVASIPATVTEVIAIANALEAGAESSDYYKVSGIISAVQTQPDKLAEYGNCNFTLQDATGSIGCYYINYLNNQKFSSVDQALNIGDTVVVVGKAKNYTNKNTGASTPELANGYLAELKRNTKVAEVIDASFSDIMQVLATLDKGATTIDAYRVKGVVSGVSTAKDKLLEYGNCNFFITDPTGATTDEITCYYTNWLDNQKFTNASDIPAIGDTVVVVAPLQNYNGKAELYKGFIESITRKAVDPVVIDDDSQLNVPAGTITCAQAIAIGKQLNDKSATAEVYYIKGIVVENATSKSSLTNYGNMTFYMVDALSDTERFEAYQVYGVDSARFTDMQQIVPGNVVVLKAKIYRYGDQIETEGLGKWFVYSSTNTFAPDTTGGTTPTLPEGTLQEINFMSNPLQLTTTDTVKVATTFTFGEIEMLVDPTANKSGAQITKTSYKMYKNTTFKLTAPTGKNIKYVGITTEGGQYGADLLTADSGSIAVDANKDGVWTGQANSVTFSNTGQVRILKLMIVFD